MIFEAEKRIAQAEEQFKSLSEYVTGETQDQDAYTVEPYYRTGEQIVGEIRDRQGAPDRPKPHNKRVRAALQSKENGFDWVAHEMNRRDMKTRLI